MNCGRGPTRPGFVKSRIAQRSPRPFSIGVPVERDPRSRGDAAQLLRGVARRVLDGLGFVEDHLRPRDVGDGVDVSHRGPVGGDHHVGFRHFGGDLVERGAVRAVVHDDAEAGSEARGLRRPVADDGGRSDHQRRAGARAGEHVREHRRRLPETHVEREAATESGRVEEAEPRQRFGLIAAQLTDEAAGRGGRFGREVRRRRQQIGSPAPAFDRDAARRAASPRAPARGATSRRPTAAWSRRVRRARSPPR